MPLLPRCLLAAVLGTALPCAGQAPGAWTELAPPGGVMAAGVQGQGKMVTYDAGSTLHVLSSITRTWQTIDKTASASLTLFNDCALLVDGLRVVAVSSYHGKPAELQLSSGALLWNGANAKNDSIVLIQDGSELHAFSAFHGRWVTRPLAANASGSVRRHVAVVHSGGELWGMGAFDGAWHDTSASSIQSLSTDGTAGFAVGPLVYAFSAHTRSWTKRNALASASFVRGDDWGIWHDANGGFAYSGLVGSFTPFSLPFASVAASSDLFALLDSNGAMHAYSAVTADFVPLGPSTATIDVGLGTALLHDASGVRGYSALRQQAQLLPIPSAASYAGSSVAYVTDGTGWTHAWSAPSASWHAAPAGTAGRVPLATTTTVAIETASDCYAFSANSGQFVPLGGAVLGMAGNPSSGPLLAYDANMLFAFDGDQSRWVSAPRTGSGVPTFRIWRTTALAIDGNSAHGVGAQAATWHRFDLGTSTPSPFANSEVAYLVDAQRIVACGMLAEIVSLQQFPHFRRIQPRGAEIAFSTAPIRDAMVIAGFAPPGVPTWIPGLGELHLDLTATFVVPPEPSPSDGVSRISWSMPPSPALAGATVFAQLLLFPNGGQPYLGDRSTVQLW